MSEVKVSRCEYTDGELAEVRLSMTCSECGFISKTIPNSGITNRAGYLQILAEELEEKHIRLHKLAEQAELFRSAIKLIKEVE